MIAECPSPFARPRFLPILPNAADPEWRAIRHRDRIGLLRLLALDCLPFEEPVDRNNAAPPPVCLAKRRQLADSLAFGIDRFATAAWVVAPMRDQALPQAIKRNS